MTLIDGDRIITAQLYDDEHEEFTEKKMNIIDYVNAYTDEGVTTADDILDKIRTEIKDIAFDWQEIDGEHESFMVVDLNDALNIIDKYKADSEDKE